MNLRQCSTTAGYRWPWIAQATSVRVWKHNRRHVVSRTDQREAYGVLTLAIHVRIRDQNVVENLVCKFIISSLREKESILRIC